ncbi:MAG: hypothetical protein ACK41C_10320 [Phenylobacterium sp.]|uniref:hypothetical protein n=1 Tax=Phenylobacterium sp. TaxID=1871053 RepID=UPI00391C3D68
MALSKSQQFALISAASLMGHYANLLSDFECETIAEVGRRWLDHRAEANVTDAEWRVIEDAVADMRAAAERPRARKAA